MCLVACSSSFSIINILGKETFLRPTDVQTAHHFLTTGLLLAGLDMFGWVSLCSVGHSLVLHQWSQDAAPQDAAPQDAASQDAASQDTASQDTASQDTASQDAASQDVAAWIVLVGGQF